VKLQLISENQKQILLNIEIFGRWKGKWKDRLAKTPFPIFFECPIYLSSIDKITSFCVLFLVFVIQIFDFYCFMAFYSNSSLDTFKIFRFFFSSSKFAVFSYQSSH
jgi:hypothetical protein